MDATSIGQSCLEVRCDLLEISNWEISKRQKKAVIVFPSTSAL